MQAVFDIFCIPNCYERMMPLRTQVEQILYIDEQAQIPAGYCPRCHGALYAPSCICLRCGEDEP